jgi:hypothetical protein
LNFLLVFTSVVYGFTYVSFPSPLLSSRARIGILISAPAIYTDLLESFFAVKCRHLGTEYNYADSVYESNCQQKCTCSATGEMTCLKEYACAPGFFRRGTYAKDPLCYEDSDAPFADQCCVTVLCSSAKGKGQESPAGSTFSPTTEKATSTTSKGGSH